MIVPGNKAIVGANAFAHESGIHQDGMLKNNTTYEIIRPETVGFKESKLVLGKHSGRHAFKEKLAELGYNLNQEQIDLVFKKFKDLADRKKNVSDDDIIALIEDKLIDTPVVYTLKSVQISYSNTSVPTASVSIEHQSGDTIEEAATGNGSVDSIYNAIDRVTKEEVELVDYKIASVTHGKDALGEVYVRMRQKDVTVQGRGISTDVLEASAKAYIDALNKLLARRKVQQKGEKIDERIMI